MYIYIYYVIKPEHFWNLCACRWNWHDLAPLLPRTFHLVTIYKSCASEYVPNTHHFLYHIPRVILTMWVQKRSKVSIAVCFVDHLRFLDHQPMGLRGKNPWKNPMGHRPFRTSTHHQKASGFRAASFGLHCVYTELHAHVVDIYIYIWMVGWWNVTVHKMGIRMKQPAFHGMTSWHLQIKKGTFPTKKPTRDTPTFSPLVPGSPPTLKRVTTPWSAEPQEFCPQLGCPFLGQLD